MINLFGRWKGVCVYGPEYGEEEGAELFFVMNIQQNNDEINGIACDTHGFGVTPGNAVVRGFIDNYLVSFVKQYESSLIMNEDGSETLIEGKLSHEINYTGICNPSDLSIEGEWEICTEPYPVAGGVLENVCTGTFWMGRH